MRSDNKIYKGVVPKWSNDWTVHLAEPWEMIVAGLHSATARTRNPPWTGSYSLKTTKFHRFFPTCFMMFYLFPPFLWPEIPLNSTKPSVLIAFRNLSSPLFNEATLLIPDLTVRSCVLCEDDFLQSQSQFGGWFTWGPPHSVTPLTLIRLRSIAYADGLKIPIYILL